MLQMRIEITTSIDMEIDYLYQSLYYLENQKNITIQGDEIQDFNLFFNNQMLFVRSLRSRLKEVLLTEFLLPMGINENDVADVLDEERIYAIAKDICNAQCFVVADKNSFIYYFDLSSTKQKCGEYHNTATILDLVG